MSTAETSSEITYFVQSRYRSRHDKLWSQWTCVSPHYATCKAARPCFRVRTEHNYLPTQVRLVRAVVDWERVPLKHHDLFAIAGSRIKVIARSNQSGEAAGGQDR